MSDTLHNNGFHPGEVVPGDNARIGRRLDEVIERARQDVGLVELLQGVESVYNTLRIDTAYLAEAVVSEQRMVKELKKRNQSLGNELGTCLSKPVSKEDMICAIESLTAHAGM